MATDRCPGQDMLLWKPGDIFDVICPSCGKDVEFFKDESRRKCRKCGFDVPNPKLNTGCAKWCEFADKCQGAEAAAAAKNNGDEEV